MAFKPLTEDQHQRIDALVLAGRLLRLPADRQRTESFLLHAHEALVDLPNLTKPQNRYNLAYDACHDVGEAMLAAYGFRTANGSGQHEVLGRFLQVVLDSPPGDAAAARFDRLRRSRNQQRYEAQPIGVAAADSAEKAARDLYTGAIERGVST